MSILMCGLAVIAGAGLLAWVAMYCVLLVEKQYPEERDE